jgi:hypothetical protein
VSLLQAQQALLHLQRVPKAGRLEDGVAYEVPAIDDSLLPKLQALSEAWNNISV